MHSKVARCGEVAIAMYDRPREWKLTRSWIDHIVLMDLRGLE